MGIGSGGAPGAPGIVIKKKPAAVAEGPPLTIRDTDAPPGRVTKVALQVARLPTGIWVSVPLVVIRGMKDGPCVFLSGALHGDELAGMMAVRALIARLKPADLSGTIFAAPIINVFGLMNETRELPDGRDLNRSFPGGPSGSLARQMAHLFVEEVVRRCHFGIDFHTAAKGRANLPQIRGDLDDLVVCDMARHFGAPIALDARLRDGSLRQVAWDLGVKVLVYETGEALRQDPAGTEIGVQGTLRVLTHLQMYSGPTVPANGTTVMTRKSSWLRAGRSGVLELGIQLGDTVKKGQRLAVVSDVLHEGSTPVRASQGGIIVGIATRPLVHRGDAVAHVAVVGDEGSETSPPALD